MDVIHLTRLTWTDTAGTDWAARVDASGMVVLSWMRGDDESAAMEGEEFEIPMEVFVRLCKPMVGVLEAVHGG